MTTEQEGSYMEVLAGAIYREIGARDFYRRIAGEIKNREGKDRFKRLSGDEEGHRKKLESWYEKLFGKRLAVDPKMLKETEIKDVKLNKQTSAMAALDLAIKAEAAAEEFYATQAGTVSSPELRDLFTKLSGEEHGHYELLTAERNSLAGGFYWFDMDSTQFLED
jgi:rubrerythrin